MEKPAGTVVTFFVLLATAALVIFLIIKPQFDKQSDNLADTFDPGSVYEHAQEQQAEEEDLPPGTTPTGSQAVGGEALG